LQHVDEEGQDGLDSRYEPVFAAGLSDDPSPLSDSALPPHHHLSGLGAAPRIRRQFHFPPPSQDPPRAPLLESTLTAPPLPRPPDLALSDGRAWRARIRRPHLFSFQQSLDSAELERLLALHPNRPWVDSLIISCRDGFWPAHSGVDPSPPPQRPFSSSEEDRRIIHTEVLAAVSKGWTSAVFDDVPEGAVVSNLFVVHRPNSKSRVVNDQSASGLNDGILRSDCPTVYDSVVDLLRLLRHLGLTSLPSESVLYKCDVSSAFKQMTMHWLWQFRQVVAVDYPEGNGSWRTRFHVEWRGAFGTRATPYLFTSLMGGVLWIVQQRLAVPHPLAYMDDAIGLDTSGRLLPLTHDGETRLVPPSLRSTLQVWNQIRLPWSWKKVLWGRQLLVTGINVDLDALTIFLSLEAVSRFAAEVAVFLDHPKRCPPLKSWQRLAGWANWAVAVRPFARPLLTPIFAKLGNGGVPKSRAFAGVFINASVRYSLAAFVRELQSSERLSLLDPGFTHWYQEDADVVVYTDACLACVDGSGAGLGFWFDLGGSRHHFFSRPPQSYRKIQFAESFTVASCIVQVLRVHLPSLSRFLVRTDSSAAVFAFDSGAADDTPFLPLRSLVSSSFLLLQQARVDLRVLHISGKDNHLADRLSRAPVRALREEFGSSLHNFIPPADMIGGAEV
jgi:hypothetical protein